MLNFKWKNYFSSTSKKGYRWTFYFSLAILSERKSFFYEICSAFVRASLRFFHSTIAKDERSFSLINNNEWTKFVFAIFPLMARWNHYACYIFNQSIVKQSFSFLLAAVGENYYYGLSHEIKNEREREKNSLSQLYGNL